MIKILIIDDQISVRKGLKMRLRLEDDLEIIAEAGDGESGIDFAQKLHPDVVVMDVGMPNMDGITATKILSLYDPEIKVIILSLHDDAITREEAMQAGAVAFIEKHDGVTALLNAIREAK
jgi:DNA-binding NarL/FixJ family response regulator